MTCLEWVNRHGPPAAAATPGKLSDPSTMTTLATVLAPPSAAASCPTPTAAPPTAAAAAAAVNQMRQQRLTKLSSPCRERTAADNLAAWQEMQVTNVTETVPSAVVWPWL
jgi:hypothetical protein